MTHVLDTQTCCSPHFTNNIILRTVFAAAMDVDEEKSTNSANILKENIYKCNKRTMYYNEHLGSHVDTKIPRNRQTNHRTAKA